MNTSFSSAHSYDRKPLRHDKAPQTSFTSTAVGEKKGVGLLKKYDTSMKDYRYYGDKCFDPDIDVFYINGINTQKQENFDSVTALHLKLREYLKGSFDMTITFYGIYNPTDGMVLDLLSDVERNG
jgi:Zn-dependent peptidase ImmA (M78 family)